MAQDPLEQLLRMGEQLQAIDQSSLEEKELKKVKAAAARVEDVFLQEFGGKIS